MRALVIGNITLDETFAVTALPRAGETLLASDAGSDLGGKGANQAIVLARCGVQTRLIARLGRDVAATRLRELLATEPLDSTGVAVIDRPTDRSIVLRASDGENCIVSTAACAATLGEAEITEALRDGPYDTFLLLQGNLTQAATTHALRLARARGLRAVLNPAPTAPWFVTLWPLADLVVLNAIEAAELSGRSDPAAAAQHIREAGTACVVITLGGAGALLCDARGITTVAAHPVMVRDTTGAGDTFTAVLAAGLLARRFDTHEALMAAAHAAALTVSRAGTLASFPTQQELALLLGS